MKRLFCCLMAVCVLTVAAQDIEKSVTLDAMTVKGARVIQKVDGQWFYPTKQQIENSANAYSLLAKLTLPHIRVDEAMNSITALTNLGTVQVRINDIIASKEDLQALDMKGVEHVELIDNPGVRYGEGVAYIINIKVKKPVSGYVIGTQLTNTLTTVNGNESLFGKINYGRSELAFSYDIDYHNLKGLGYDFQLNLLSLSGYYGQRPRLVAESLLEEGLYDNVGTDLHHLDRFEDYLWDLRLTRRQTDAIEQLLDNNTRL